MKKKVISKKAKANIGKIHGKISRSKTSRKISGSKSSKKRLSRKQNIDSKLSKILAVENRLLHEEKTVEHKEETLEQEEKNIETKEKNIEDKEKHIETEEKDINKISQEITREDSDLQKIEQMESEIKQEVGEHPLAQVSLKDVFKGLIGSFIGLAIHYTFVYGVEISQNLTLLRATLLFPLTFVVGLLFIYATGFRKVKDTRLLMFMPIRLFVLYVCSLIMSIVVLYIFYPQFGQGFEESYKMVAGVMLAAVVGACTADLLGKE